MEEMAETVESELVGLYLKSVSPGGGLLWGGGWGVQ